MKHLLSLALLGLPLLAAARPAYPGVVAVTQPDGSKIEVIGHGDENFNYFTDASGKYILEHNAKGFLAKAVRNGRVLTPNATDLNLLAAERAPYALGKANAMHRMAALDSDGRTTYPTTSEDVIPALVILLEFADTPFTIPDTRNTFDRMLNEKGFSDYNAKGSAADYYRDASNGKFNVHFDVAPIVKLKYGREYYNGNDLDPTGKNKHRRIAECIIEALDQLDPEVDFSKYDLDKNGEIDNIFFYYSGYGQADSHDITTFWPHQGSYFNHEQVYGYPHLVKDGVSMRTYACSNELNFVLPAGAQQPYLDGIGAFCHEYGHVLGLPDLYDTLGNGTKAPGYYSIMDTGSYCDNSTCPPRFSAYEMWVCRWAEAEPLEAGKLYTLAPFGTSNDPKFYNLKIKRPVGTSYYKEQFFFECRDMTGWDAGWGDNAIRVHGPKETGIFIWRVNYKADIWDANNVNSLGAPYVEMMYSSATTLAWPGKNGAMYSFPGEDNELYTQNYNPTAQYWITDITYDDAAKKATFGYNIVTERPYDTTVLHQPSFNYNEENAVREITLTWDPVKGAGGYFLTVTRIDGNGNRKIVNGYDEKYVGDVTSVTLPNQTKTAWNQQFEVYVRVLNHVPADGVSNTLSFIPKDVSSSVDGIIADDAPIYGVQGGIVAPESAAVFNLNGVAVGKDNLPAGIYLVRFNGETVKVVVK